MTNDPDGGVYPIRAVTVYCASSPSVDRRYLDEASEFGALLGRSGRTLVYGGGGIGLMGAVSAGCRGAGGRVVGVLTERLRDAEQMDRANSENIVVRTMRERKAIMEAWGDALVVLPGGLGTLEEFFEVFVGRLLGEHRKPLLLMDMPAPERNGGQGYYAPLLEMLDHMIEGRFVRSGVLKLLEVVSSAQEAGEALETLSRREPLRVEEIDNVHPYLPNVR